MKRTNGLDYIANVVPNIPWLHVVVLPIAMLLSACTADLEICDQETGNQHFKAGKYDVAYKLLKNCEERDEVSGETLFHLASLVGSGTFGKYGSKKMRDLKENGLYLMAGIQGHKGAILHIARLFQSQYEAEGQTLHADTASCLRDASDLDTHFRPDAVRKCIGLKKKGSKDG